MNGDDRTINALRRAFTSGTEAAPPDVACPAPETIWDAVNLHLSAPERRKVVEHLRICPACAAEWRAAMEPGDLREPGAARAARRPPALRELKVWLPLAAAAFLAVLAGLSIVLRHPGRSEPAPSFRDGEGSEIRSLVPDRESLPRGRFALRWTPVEQDARYTLKVDRQDLTPVTVVRNLGRSWYQVPEETLAGVPSGETIVWRVEARLVDGTRVRSDAFLVRLE